MNPSNPVILLDPHPRRIDLIFSPHDKARLERLGRVIWHDGSSTPDAVVEQHLPNAIAIIGQTPMPRERLDRAPNLRRDPTWKATSAQTSTTPSASAATSRAVVAPFFAQPVAEMALGLALDAARRIAEADAAIRRGDESLYGDKDNYDSFLLKGKTLGLLGCGNLGRGSAAAAAARSRATSWCTIRGSTPACCAAWMSSRSAWTTCSRARKVLFILAATTTENQGSSARASSTRCSKARS